MAEQGFSVTYIAKQQKISRTTVYKYLEMSSEEAFEWVNSLSSRKKKLIYIKIGLLLGCKSTHI